MLNTLFGICSSGAVNSRQICPCKIASVLPQNSKNTCSEAPPQFSASANMSQIAKIAIITPFSARPGLGNTNWVWGRMRVLTRSRPGGPPQLGQLATRVLQPPSGDSGLHAASITAAGDTVPVQVALGPAGVAATVTDCGPAGSLGTTRLLWHSAPASTSAGTPVSAAGVTVTRASSLQSEKTLARSTRSAPWSDSTSQVASTVVPPSTSA